MMFRQANYDKKLLIEYPDTENYKPYIEVDNELKIELPENLKRTRPLNIPNLSEETVVRHFVRLSQMNYGVDTGIYPLGSCTMKYNPKLLEELASLPEACNLHPAQHSSTVQGTLKIMYEMQQLLAKIAGMDAVTLQPAAGAHGELTGLLMIDAYFKDKGESRTEVLIPETAHGTNPASSAMCGFDIVEIPMNAKGCIDLNSLKKAISSKTACLMLTNPNTLGIFEEDVLEIATIVHDAGALLYYDGANLNAILGYTNPGKMNFDVMHFNLHKTFGTPHGAGGPGAGPVAVKKILEPYLPVPTVGFDNEKYYFNYAHSKTIGKVRNFYANWSVILKAYIYILLMGGDTLKSNTEQAVYNANYLKDKLKDHFDFPYNDLRKHEFVVSAQKLKENKGIRALDIAKRILDYGYHAPTIYFPHLVPEAMMFEPTETESEKDLEEFANTIIKILSEDPETLKKAPTNTSVSRVDELSAAKYPVLTWRMVNAGR